MILILANVEVAVAVLLSGSICAPEGCFLEIDYWSDGLGYNDVAFAVDKLPAQKRPRIAYKTSE